MVVTRSNRTCVLAVNCGSTSIKVRVFAIRQGELTTLATLRLRERSEAGEAWHGSFRIEGGAAFDLEVPSNQAAGGVGQRVAWLLDRLTDHGVIDSADHVIVGHRLVTGGPDFESPVALTGGVLRSLRACVWLAPQHLPPALEAVDAAQDKWPQATQVAVFDTTFHTTMPEVARRYAVPQAWLQAGIRRYGAHGLAHRWMAERARTVCPGDRRIVSLQLGGGCSACAMLDGRSMDTTMGLTPLEGLVMATRSGDIDPAVVDVAHHRLGRSVQDTLATLQHGSGLLGVGGSASVSDLLKMESAKEDARIALDLYAYRIAKTIGGYAVVLGGLDAILFGGGVGENVPAMRERICSRLEVLNVRLDSNRNRASVGMEGLICSGDSAVRVAVVPVDEEQLIARDAADVARTK